MARQGREEGRQTEVVRLVSSCAIWTSTTPILPAPSSMTPSQLMKKGARLSRDHTVPQVKLVFQMRGKA